MRALVVTTSVDVLLDSGRKQSIFVVNHGNWGRKDVSC